MFKSLKKDGLNYVTILLILGSILLLAQSTEYFYNGIKNFDWGYNLGLRGAMENKTYYDIGDNFEKLSSHEVYVIGVQQIKYGFHELSIACVLLLITTMINFYERIRK